VKLALIGDPVAHSRSPALHRAMLQEAGIEGSYTAIRVPRGNGIDVVRRMRLDGFTGCNVTHPLKEEVLRACDVLTDEARRARAVNTIFFSRAIVGTTTDGIGARIALETLADEPIALHRIGVLGTGATARAILVELHDNDAYAFVWGRDPEKVAALCTEFEAQPWPVHEPPEMVISTLPPEVSLPRDLIESLQHVDLVMDANYGERSTLRRVLHREVVDGTLMLEAQARASFDFWLARLEGVGGGEEQAG
jgi:shikimate dehydrogenase